MWLRHFGANTVAGQLVGAGPHDCSLSPERDPPKRKEGTTGPDVLAPTEMM